MTAKCKIRKSFNGHQVEFTIGNQTFYLQEQTQEQALDREMTSRKYAKWYKKQLETAFKKLEAYNSENKMPSEEAAKWEARKWASNTNNKNHFPLNWTNRYNGFMVCFAWLKSLTK